MVLVRFYYCDGTFCLEGVTMELTVRFAVGVINQFYCISLWCRRYSSIQDHANASSSEAATCYVADARNEGKTVIATIPFSATTIVGCGKCAGASYTIYLQCPASVLNLLVNFCYNGCTVVCW